MTGPSRAPADLAATLDEEIGGLDRELTEIELLVGQARIEAGRHEQKRAHVEERLAAASSASRSDPAEVAEQNSQLVLLTKRAALMDAQIEVLAGKQKVLARYKEGLTRIRGEVAALDPAAAAAHGSAGPPGAAPVPSESGSPGMWRLVQGAQEDLRRDIARAMHDGPAQSLTNIVLQAQIVERLLDRDPAAARDEVKELVGMVQRTLDATKTFIFDVRPMVLDDLGLVPTLRRFARDRSRRTQVPVEFDSLGTDRRLSIELESTVFRIVDQAVAGYSAGRPERVVIALYWGDSELDVTVRTVVAALVQAPTQPARPPASGAEVPPMLAAFMDDRRARPPEVPGPSLPPDIQREIADRIASVGGQLRASGEGPEVRVAIALPAPEGAPPAAGE